MGAIRISWLSAGMNDLPRDDAWMDDRERSRIGQMRYTKRRQESRLSRWTAKTTVARALGLPPDAEGLSRVQVRNASDGAPEVQVDGAEAGIVIGMTDRADWSVCSVLHSAHRVGCDLELVEPRSAAFVRDYFTVNEQKLVGDATERDMLANLIWSAKESTLKVLRTGLRKDTRNVEIELPGEEHGGWRSLVASCNGARFPGWWIRYDQFVLTCVAAATSDPPVSLVDPPALASAVPSHAWMDNPLHGE